MPNGVLHFDLCEPRFWIVSELATISYAPSVSSPPQASFLQPACQQTSAAIPTSAFKSRIADEYGANGPRSGVEEFRGRNHPIRAITNFRVASQFPRIAARIRST